VPGQVCATKEATRIWARGGAGTPLKVIWLFPPAVQAPRAYAGETGWLSAIGMPCQMTMPMRRTTYVISGPGSPGGAFCSIPRESVWVAARSPGKLAEQVEAAARGEAGPDEGDKTPDVAYPPQMWAG